MDADTGLRSPFKRIGGYGLADRSGVAVKSSNKTVCFGLRVVIFEKSSLFLNAVD
jgi:hypothetical protein